MERTRKSCRILNLQMNLVSIPKAFGMDAASSPLLERDRGEQANCPLGHLTGPIQRFPQKVLPFRRTWDVEPRWSCLPGTETPIGAERLPLNGKLGGFVAPVPRRNVLRVTVLLVGMGGTFGMIGGIFDAFHRGGLKRLIGVRQILDGVFGSFRFRGEAFCADGLTAAIHANFTGISAEFVGPGFEILLQFR